MTNTEAPVFDPFAPKATEAERPRLQLGADSFVLAEVTYSRERKLRDIFHSFQQMPEDADSLRVAELAGQLAEAACQDADGVGALIVEAYQQDEITVHGLTGLVEFIGEWLRGETDPEE
jgi:hypothetical protein